MILLWGLPEDGPLAAVRTALEGMDVPHFFLNQRDVAATTVELRVDAVVGGGVTSPAGTIDLAAIAAVYLRPYDARKLPSVANAGEESEPWRRAVQVDDILMSWLEMTPALVVNRGSAMASNSSKPYQSMLIRSFGFAAPDTLITTDRAEALAFWERHGEVIYKSVSGVRSIVSRLGDEHRGRLDDLCWCPTQFQQLVPGNDYRVHVVGDEVFASEIVSDADDYRYAGRQNSDTEIRDFDLPADCAERCRALAAGLDLSVAGIDLRRTPDGEWYCFEVNPSPGFTYYQHATGQPIDRAIARLLASRAA